MEFRPTPFPFLCVCSGHTFTSRFSMQNCVEQKCEAKLTLADAACMVIDADNFFAGIDRAWTVTKLSFNDYRCANNCK